MKNVRFGVPAVILCALASGSALADITGSFVISATNSLGTGSLTVNLADGTYDPTTGNFDYNLSRPFELMSARGMVARVDRFSIAILGDPQVNLNFNVFAGAAETQFTITSALNSFPVITDAEARASASITVTDNTGDGASLAGLQTGNRAYTSHYNGFVPSGTLFSNLVGPITVPGTDPFGTSTGSGAFPAVDWQSIGSVTDMSAQFRFNLSAQDGAAGTSTYVVRPVIPAPGAGVMLVGGLLVAARRRRA